MSHLKSLLLHYKGGYFSDEGLNCNCLETTHNNKCRLLLLCAHYSALTHYSVHYLFCKTVNEIFFCLVYSICLNNKYRIKVELGIAANVHTMMMWTLIFCLSTHSVVTTWQTWWDTKRVHKQYYKSLESCWADKWQPTVNIAL